MSNVYDHLRALIEWYADDGAQVLTLYLDISDPDAAVRYADEECPLLLDAESDAPGARAFAALIEDELARLPDRVERARAEGYAGMALFACADPPLSRALELRFPFQNQALAGRDPFLKQLLFYAEEYERSVCVILRRDRIRYCEVHVGDMTPTLDVHPTHGRSLLEELNVQLNRLMQNQPSLHLILCGPADQVAEAERILQPGLQARIIDRLATALQPEDPTFLPLLHQGLQAWEREVEAQGVTQLLRKHAAQEGAVLGLVETLEAINKGTLKKLYVLRDYTAQGWICDACGYMGVGAEPPACVACGASVAAAALEEHLLDQAAGVGAVIETVHESEVLERSGGVGGETF